MPPTKLWFFFVMVVINESIMIASAQAVTIFTSDLAFLVVMSNRIAIGHLAPTGKIDCARCAMERNSVRH